jgi:hypothetical protein
VYSARRRSIWSRTEAARRRESAERLAFMRENWIRRFARCQIGLADGPRRPSCAESA